MKREKGKEHRWEAKKAKRVKEKWKESEVMYEKGQEKDRERLLYINNTFKRIKRNLE